MNLRTEIISFRNLTKRMHNRTVIDIDKFALHHGECVLLRGLNGAGKSTLLKIFAGLIVPDSSEVTINGTTSSYRQAYRTFRNRVVYLHQSPYLFDRSVESNIAYGLSVRGIDKTQIRSEVEMALDWAGLNEVSKRNARELSGGEKQRVALTRARILKPELLLLDEPTTAMDEDAHRRTYELINDLVAGGITIYVATHEPVHYLKYHHAIEIVQGQIQPLKHSAS